MTATRVRGSVGLTSRMKPEAGCAVPEGGREAHGDSCDALGVTPPHVWVAQPPGRRKVDALRYIEATDPMGGTERLVFEYDNSYPDAPGCVVRIGPRTRPPCEVDRLKMVI